MVLTFNKKIIYSSSDLHITTLSPYLQDTHVFQRPNLITNLTNKTYVTRQKLIPFDSCQDADYNCINFMIMLYIIDEINDQSFMIKRLDPAKKVS